jgi:two-component system OmpR family sensor kinase
VVALALLVFGMLLYALLARGVMTNQDDALRVRANQAAASLARSTPASTVAPVVPADLRSSTEIFVEVFSLDWALLYATGEPAVMPTVHSAGFATQGGFRLYTRPIDSGYVVTGQSTRVPQSNLSGIVVFLVVSAVPALVAALLASWLVAGRALMPLESVASAAEDIGRTRDFGRRLPPAKSRDEVARLTASFNGMLSRLQDAFESQRRFVADASHELRTPLTTIQGNAGLLASREVAEDVRRAAASDISAEGARMSRLVDRMLTLARADAGLELRLTAIDLKPLVDEVCRQAMQLYPQVELATSAVEAWVDGDEDGLRQLLWILLDNAQRYARSAVKVDLSVADGWARLVVADDGPGVPVDQQERIFQRFYRSDRARTGDHAGLGLAIAHWIVEQHHGRIVAGDAVVGGAAFLVDVPLLRTS